MPSREVNTPLVLWICAAICAHFVLGEGGDQIAMFHDDEVALFHTAETYAPGIIRHLLKAGWPDDVIINVNFPDLEPDEIKEIEVCAQGIRDVQNLMWKLAAVLEGRSDPALLEAYSFEDVGARAPRPWLPMARRLYANWLSSVK